MEFTCTVFRANSGDVYLYDAITSNILPVPKNLSSAYEAAFQELASSPGHLQPKEPYDTQVRKLAGILRSFLDHGLLARNEIKEIELPYSKQELIHRLNNAIEILILNLTNKCNLKCTYCSYRSFHLEDIGSRSLCTKMTISTARKAIDFYYNHSRQSLNSPHIQFYGGEPLLEIDTLREVIIYARQIFKGQKPRFLIVTNGVLLNSEFLDIFAESPDINVCITLNGSKDNHDGERCFPNGQGSHDIIMNNIRSLRKRCPAGYEQRVTFLANYRDSLAISDIGKFYAGSNILCKKIPNLSPINKAPTNYNLKQTIAKTRDTYSFILKSFLAQQEDQDQNNRIINLLSSKILVRLHDRTLTDGHTAFFTGVCMPLVKKLFVKCNGAFNICEKAPDILDFGDVFSEFNYDEILRLVEDFKSFWRNRCNHCTAVRLCDICFDEYLIIKKYGKDLENTFCDISRTKVEQALRFFVDL